MEKTRTDRKLKDLPLPRLQLTWTQKDDGWECDYAILVPLRRIDIRNEGPNGAIGRGPGYAKAHLGTTTTTGGCGPLDIRTGEPVLDTPFRDGAHIGWDSFRLGMPGYVVLVQDGTTYIRYCPPIEVEK